MKLFVKFFLVFLGVWVPLIQAEEVKFVNIPLSSQSSSLSLWTQSFGDPKHPAILLIMGTGLQGIMWTDEFCEMLAGKGYYVIRYDQRGLGASSPVSKESEDYHMQDLANDAIAILDAYHLPKATVIGFSMGGMVCQFLGASFSDRLQGIVFLATSPDFEPVILAAAQVPLLTSSLPGPTEAYQHYLKATSKKFPRKDKIETLLSAWRLLTGAGIDFDESFHRTLLQKALKRSQGGEGINKQRKAIQLSYRQAREILKDIRVPALVIHGKQDPIFPEQHGKALAERLPNAQFILYPQLGHFLAKEFYQPLCNDIDHFVQQTLKASVHP